MAKTAEIMAAKASRMIYIDEEIVIRKELTFNAA